MNTETLYIIGNGFDLYHGIPSSYWHFRNYVKSKSESLFEALERYFNPDQLWSDFEATLADLDTDHILDEASNYFEQYGADDWSDSYHHNYQYEIGQRIKLVTLDLRKIFTEWILNMEIPSHSDDLLKLDRKAIFLNFNYTSTLSKLYKVDRSYITYIHNEAKDLESNLLLGHGVNPGPISETDTEDQDPRIIEGQKIIDEYFVDSYKPVENIISENKDFFKTLKLVKEVNIYGHSLSDVDLPYFREIIKQLDLPKVIWRVSYFKKDEYEQRKLTLLSLGVEEANIIIDKLENFDTGQFSLI